jgi:hypothetical protein
MPRLMKLGYEYGEPILDWPPEAQDVDQYSEPLFQTNNHFIEPGDLLLQTTRPPLDDVEQNDRKRLRRSYTDIEDHLFRLWGNYLERSARSHVFLHQRFHRSLALGFENRRQMKFYQTEEGAPYMALNDCTGSGWQKSGPGDAPRTAAFLLRCDEAWARGPGLVSAFGMDGTATAVWGYRLGRDYSDLLTTPGFVVAELVNTGIPERPTNMMWASDWEVRIILHEKWA